MRRRSVFVVETKAGLSGFVRAVKRGREHLEVCGGIFTLGMYSLGLYAERMCAVEMYVLGVFVLWTYVMEIH